MIEGDLPLPIVDQAEWDTLQRGSEITIVGYGDNPSVDRSVQRWALTEIDAFSRSGLEFQAGGGGIAVRKVARSAVGLEVAPSIGSLVVVGRRARRALASRRP
jgi:hypothetical protein